MNPSSGTDSRSRELFLRRSPRLLCKFRLRRSYRLLGKSATIVPKLIPPKRPRKSCKIPAKKSVRTMPESPILATDPKTYCPYGGIETIMREGREHQAYHFKKMYSFKNDCPENKTCILPCGSFSWDENSFGITYVALWGKYVTYVAFKKNLAPIEDRLGGYLAHNHEDITFDYLGTTIISEIEVRVDRPSESSQEIPYPCGEHAHHKRFAIVSVAPNTKNDSGGTVDKEAAVNYLKVRMRKDAILNTREAEKTVIEALQLLLKEEFKPEDIWVHKAFFGVEQCLESYVIKYRLEMIQTGSE